MATAGGIGGRRLSLRLGIGRCYRYGRGASMPCRAGGRRRQHIPFGSKARYRRVCGPASETIFRPCASKGECCWQSGTENAVPGPAGSTKGVRVRQRPTARSLRRKKTKTGDKRGPVFHEFNGPEHASLAISGGHRRTGGPVRPRVDFQAADTASPDDRGTAGVDRQLLARGGARGNGSEYHRAAGERAS